MVSLLPILHLFLLSIMVEESSQKSAIIRRFSPFMEDQNPWKILQLLLEENIPYPELELPGQPLMKNLEEKRKDQVKEEAGYGNLWTENWF
jgi:hypothetical protein